MAAKSSRPDHATFVDFVPKIKATFKISFTFNLDPFPNPYPNYLRHFKHKITPQKGIFSKIEFTSRVT